MGNALIMTTEEKKTYEVSAKFGFIDWIKELFKGPENPKTHFQQMTELLYSNRDAWTLGKYVQVEGQRIDSRKFIILEVNTDELIFKKLYKGDACFFEPWRPAYLGTSNNHPVALFITNYSFEKKWFDYWMGIIITRFNINKFNMKDLYRDVRNYHSKETSFPYSFSEFRKIIMKFKRDNASSEIKDFILCLRFEPIRGYQKKIYIMAAKDCYAIGKYCFTT